MESKYYTPEIEEFHVGFEFEMKVYGEEDEWVKCIYNTITDSCFNKDSNGIISIPDGFIRVKYLDQEDIESLEWKLHSQGNINFFTFRKFKDDFIQIHVSFAEPPLVSFSWYDGRDTPRFLIRNKSELKKLMKQLGI